MEPIKQKAKRTPPPPPSPTADKDSGGGGVDRISALDDDLCELILRLAHLDMRELVRTSVLSKRWRFLWKRVPVLGFFGWPKLESARDLQQYITIVNDVLAQRAAATAEARIDELKFLLSFDARGQTRLSKTAKAAVEAWILYAMHHQVKGLRLDLRLLRTKKSVIDLDDIPSSPKLECMHLQLLFRIDVRLPRTAVFTSLRDLTLQWVQLAAGSGRLLSRLLSSACCPSLQKLHMENISFEHAETKKLVLDAGELLELSMDSICGMELLELRTPKLLSLNIKDCMDLKPQSFQNRGLVHGPLLHVWRLDIDLITHKGEGDDDDKFENRSNTNICLLKCCGSSVRCLLVHLHVPRVEERRFDLIKDIPWLPNVTSLLVNIDARGQRHSFEDGVAYLLTRFENLEYLSLHLNDSHDSPHICLKKDEYYLDGDIILGFICNHPEHWRSSNIFLANLRKADFRGMAGTGCELRFLQFVLANATNLQSVTVSFNLYFIKEEEVQDRRMHLFLDQMLRDGTWAVCENEDQDFSEYEYNKCSKLYKWTQNKKEDQFPVRMKDHQLHDAAPREV